MSQQTIGMIIGGIIPAILLGVFSIFQKASTKQGISPGMLLVVMGINIVIIGVIYCLIFNEYKISLKSGTLASFTGIFWGISTCLISFALAKYAMPICKLVPLFNMNTLVAVCLGLLIFAEWQHVNLLKLFIASFLIILGGTLAANA